MRKNSPKNLRVNQEVARTLAVIIRELKDPRVDPVTLTVVRVEVAHDLSYCKAYVSSLHGIEEAKDACKVLNSGAKGFIRKELGARIAIRKTPDLRFIPDDSIEKGIEMFKKLEMSEKKEHEA